MAMISGSVRLFLSAITCALLLSACDELIEPVIIPTPMPIPTIPRDEESEIGPPRTPSPSENTALEENYIHPAAIEIKELWKSTVSKLQSQLADYPQAFSFESRLEKASEIRKQWWDLNRKLLSDRNVDFSVLRTYSPFIDSVIQMLDNFYSVEQIEYGESELARAQTEIKLMNDRIERLR